MDTNITHSLDARADAGAMDDTTDPDPVVPERPSAQLLQKSARPTAIVDVKHREGPRHGAIMEHRWRTRTTGGADERGG